MTIEDDFQAVVQYAEGNGFTALPYLPAFPRKGLNLAKFLHSQADRIMFDHDFALAVFGEWQEGDAVSTTGIGNPPPKHVYYLRKLVAFPSRSERISWLKGYIGSQS